jgi:hypothetical protein
MSSYPPIVLISFNQCSAARWKKHIGNIRRLVAFPRPYRHFVVTDNIGVFQPAGPHGEVDDCMLNADFRSLHILLRINGLDLCRDVEGVLTYLPTAYRPHRAIYELRSVSY